MSWSYASPTASNKDVVRYLLQDTNTNEQLVSDEEIFWELSQQSNVRTVAAHIAEVIARKFARQASTSTPDFRVDLGGRAKFYRDLAKELRSRAGVAPYVGGISIDDKDTYKEDTDRVQPVFRRDQFAYESSEDTQDET